MDGTLVIQTDGSTSNYVGSVRYSTTTGTNVQINANDIARYFKKSTGGTLNYVMFTGVPSTGALKLSTANLSSVKPFTDTSDLYVQALNAAGIVEGYFSNGTSTFRPNNTLTRGQVSAIVWRMQNYQK